MLFFNCGHTAAGVIFLAWNKSSLILLSDCLWLVVSTHHYFKVIKDEQFSTSLFLPNISYTWIKEQFKQLISGLFVLIETRNPIMISSKLFLILVYERKWSNDQVLQRMKHLNFTTKDWLINSIHLT